MMSVPSQSFRFYFISLLGVLGFLRTVSVVSVLIFFTAGCSLFSAKKEEKVQVTEKVSHLTRFSELPQAPAISQRNYKRMSKQRLEEESEVQASAGSLWVMEGQGAYLFSQNKVRKEGDTLTLKVEGAAQKQVEQKVSVIRKLLKQIELEEAQRKEAALRKDASDSEKQKSASEQEGTNLADGQKTAVGSTAARSPASEAAAAEKEEPLDLASIPTRVVERTSDGTYRVKGQLPFMIGKREYKVLVAGMVRPEDFNDEGISSNKLLDPQYDVVSLRRKNE